MMEPLFGTGSPFATGAPSPGPGWFQLPLPVTNRPLIGPSVPGFGMLPAMTFVPQPIPQPVPQPIPQEPYGPGGVPDGSAQGLLAAVAMRRGQPMGPSNDQEIEDFMYDALEYLPGATDVEVRCESGGRITLTGNVAHKRLKHDVGEIAWTIPAVSDVQNNLTITARRRRSPRESEGAQPGGARKQG